MTTLNLSVQEDLTRRLRRIEGQVRGVQKMIEENRPSDSILQQLSAVHSAVHGVGIRIISESYANSLNTASALSESDLMRKVSEFASLLERLP
jgi:DNA-binding FrmR family transcriptional regulator